MNPSMVEFYTSFLSFLGFSVDSKGNVLIPNPREPDKRENLLVDGKPVIIPTADYIRSDLREKFVFNPLAEDLLGTESATIVKIRYWAGVRINTAVFTLIINLLNVIASTSVHAKLDDEQLKLLTKIKQVDDKTIDKFTTFVTKAFKESGEKLFVNIAYIKKGGMYKDKKYKRVGIVTFPFYEDLKKGEYKDKFRIADVDALISLMQYIFPLIDDPEGYNYASDDKQAPYFHATASTILNIVSTIIDTIDVFSSILGKDKYLEFDSKWFETIHNLTVYASQARMLSVDGPVADDREPSATREIVPRNTREREEEPAKGIVKTSNGIDFSSLARSDPGLRRLSRSDDRDDDRRYRNRDDRDDRRERRRGDDRDEPWWASRRGRDRDDDRRSRDRDDAWWARRDRDDRRDTDIVTTADGRKLARTKDGYVEIR